MILAVLRRYENIADDEGRFGDGSSLGVFQNAEGSALLRTSMHTIVLGLIVIRPQRPQRSVSFLVSKYGLGRE